MDRLLRVVLALTAVDRMSTVVRSATGRSMTDLEKLQKKGKDLMDNGAKLMVAGTALAASLAPAIKAFAELEDSAADLESSMMDSFGKTGPEFVKMNELAEQLGDKLPGNTSDFQRLFQTLKENGVGAETILNGVGKSAAYLGVAIRMPYEEAGKFAAKMKEATGTADEDMLKFMDTIARVKNMGVEATEMQYAFGRSAGALKLVGIQGLEASKQMATLYATLIRSGLSGETIGTGFASILSAALDPKKYTAVKEAAAKLGVEFKLFDKGKFLGIENLIVQLDKLKGFSASQRQGVIGALTGGGQDAQMLQILVSNGVEGFKKMNEQMSNQADLNTKVEVRLKTLKSIWEATTGTIDNMLAALGTGLAPVLKIIAGLFGTLAGWLKRLMQEYPSIAKFITMFVGISAAVVTVIGVILSLRGAFILLNIVMGANPFIRIAMIIIALVSLIYANWGKITKFFSWVWEGIKSGFKSFVGWFVSFTTPFGFMNLIAPHWDGFVAYFGGIWDSVGNAINKFIDWVKGLGSQFFQAGANIINSLVDGIVSMANKPIDAIKNVVKEMRDFFPFSPAKVGPLRDIHKIKLVETIAASIKSKPLTDAVHKVTGDTAQAFGLGGGRVRPVFGGGGMGGSMNITFAPQISGGGNSADIVQSLRGYMPQFMQMIRAEMDRESRKSYA